MRYQSQLQLIASNYNSDRRANAGTAPLWSVRPALKMGRRGKDYGMQLEMRREQKKTEAETAR